MPGVCARAWESAIRGNNPRSVYQSISAIGAKIDGLAEWLTGERGYFNKGLMSNTASPEVLEKWQRWDAIERGDEEWPK